MSRSMFACCPSCSSFSWSIDSKIIILSIFDWFVAITSPSRCLRTSFSSPSMSSSVVSVAPDEGALINVSVALSMRFLVIVSASEVSLIFELKYYMFSLKVSNKVVSSKRLETEETIFLSLFVAVCNCSIVILNCSSFDRTVVRFSIRILSEL